MFLTMSRTFFMCFNLVVTSENTDVLMWIIVFVNGSVPWPQLPSLEPKDLDLGAASQDLRMNTHRHI